MTGRAHRPAVLAEAQRRNASAQSFKIDAMLTSSGDETGLAMAGAPQRNAELGACGDATLADGVSEHAARPHEALLRHPSIQSFSSDAMPTSIGDDTGLGTAKAQQREQRLQAWRELRDLLDGLPSEDSGDDLVDFVDAAADLADEDSWADSTRLASLPEWSRRRGYPSAGAAYAKAVALS